MNEIYEGKGGTAQSLMEPQTWYEPTESGSHPQRRLLSLDRKLDIHVKVVPVLSKCLSLCKSHLWEMVSNTLEKSMMIISRGIIVCQVFCNVMFVMSSWDL